MSKFKQYPKIPNEIIDAIDDHRLIIFTGAGLSALFGYPLWRKFALDLVNECCSKNILSLSEKEYLDNSSLTSMQIITIAYNRLLKKLGKEEANKIFLSCLKFEESEEKDNIIKKISRFLSHYNCPIITTNADLSLDKTLYFNCYDNVENFFEWDKETKLKRIIHLHGSIEKFESLIFTSEQYAEAYSVDSTFGKNLNELFIDNKKVLLFIGCSLSEFELLRYFIKIRNEEYQNLFLLNGYLDSEELKYEFDKDYYGSLGISLISYSREKNNYSQLINVLSKWDKEVTSSTLAHLAVKEDYKIALDELPNEKSSKLIKGRMQFGYDKYLYKSLLESKYLYEWLVELSDTNLFKLSSNINKDTKKTSFSIVQGFELLLQLIQKDSNNKNIVEFVRTKINEVYNYLANNELLNRKMNDGLIDNIFNIILYNEILFNECHSYEFFNIYAKCKYFTLYSIVDSFLNLDVSSINADLVIEFYNAFYDDKHIGDYRSLLCDNRMLNIISIYPKELFDYSLNKLLDMNEFSYLNVNSFYEFNYGNKICYSNNREIISAFTILKASIYLEDDILNGIIDELLKSNKRQLKKCALALININFNRLQNVFANNIKDFFNDSNYYNDLCFLLENNYKNFNKKTKEEIRVLLNENFGGVADEVKNRLENHINNILSKYDSNYINVLESKEDLEFISNFDKDIVIRNTWFDLKNEFKNLSYDEAIELYNKNKSGSNVKVYSYAQAFAEYISKDIKQVSKNIEELDTFVLNYIYSYSKDKDELFKLSKAILEFNIKDSNILYDSILRNMVEFIDDKIAECFDIFNHIDSNKLLGDVNFTVHDYLFKCINHGMYSYIRVLLAFAYNGKIDQQTLMTRINSLLKTYNNYIVKGCLALNIEYILNLQNTDDKFINNLISIILNNQFNDLNLSYICLLTNNIDIIHYLFDRVDFYKFIEYESYIKDITNAQGRLLSLATYSFLCNKLDSNFNGLFTSMIDSKNLSFLNDILSELPNVKDIVKSNRLEDFFNLLHEKSKQIIDLLQDYEVGYYIMYINKIICIYDDINSMWVFLLDLLKTKKGYSLVDFYEVVYKYIDNKEHKEDIIKIMDYILKVCEKNSYSYSKFEKCLNLFEGKSDYTKQYKKWLNSYSRINVNFMN